MRILIIHNFYLQQGGEHTVFMAEQELLRAHGHVVDTLTFDNADIRSAWDKLVLAFKGIYNSQAYKKTWDKIQDFRPDIIHVHNIFYVGSPAIYYAAQKAGVPVVQTLHNYRLICPSAFLFHDGKVYEKSIHKTFPLDPIFKKVWNNSALQTASLVAITGIHKVLGTWRKKVDAYIVFTDFARQVFLDSSLGVKADKFFIKPNFTADPGEASSQREDFFVYVGRLSQEKGIETLLAACEMHPFPLKIIGDGPLREKVEEAASRNAHIQYLGKREKAFVMEQLSQCKALLFPSVWYEGMPMVILEALSNGAPVIASRLGNPPFMLDENESGLLFEAGNPQELVQKIQRISQDEAFAIQLSKGARERYEAAYSPSQNYHFLMAIYEKLVASSGESLPREIQPPTSLVNEQ